MCAHRRSSLNRPRKGAAATELALVLPLVLVLIGGTLDLGRAIHAQMVLSQAIRVGAEYGATHRVSPSTLANWKNKISTAVSSEMQYVSGFDPARLTVAVQIIDDSDDHQIVTVSATYALNQLLFLRSGNGQMTLSQKFAWRQFR